LLAITLTEIMDKIITIAVQVSRFLLIYTNVHTQNDIKCNIIVLIILFHRCHICSSKSFIFCL